MFLTPNDRKPAVQNAAAMVAKRHNLENFIEIPVRFVHSGVEVLLGQDHSAVPQLA